MKKPMYDIAGLYEAIRNPHKLSKDHLLLFENPDNLDQEISSALSRVEGGSVGQKASVAYRFLPIFEALASERHKSSWKYRGDNDEAAPETGKGQAADILATRFGISRTALQMFMRVKGISEKAADLVESGRAPLGRIHRAIKVGQEIDDALDHSATQLYIIRAINGGPVKIGVSRCPEARLKDLQTGYPYQLKIVQKMGIVRGSKTEKFIHTLLNEHRLNGEWFEYADVVADFCRDPQEYLYKILGDDLYEVS